ncbi:MAG TPA: MlaD family protein [Aquabacterium sp.]|nr:MlaD family protein [Aquabacterium sp.]HQC94212.1 MlaD family protein [Aquabacterium sp.]
MTAPDHPTPEALPAAPVVPHLQAKAAALLVLLALLVAGAVLYLLYARGSFEPTQRLVLLADDAEGVTVGMDLTFSGFPIGRVRDITLSPEGNARIAIDVPKKDAHWLRQGSIFTLVRGLVGNTNLRAYTGNLKDALLPDNAERKVLAGDATAEIPQMLAAVRELVQRASAIAAPDGALAGTLANLQAATARLNGPAGALGMVTGNDADAKKLIATLDRTDALLRQATTLAASLDRVAVQTERQVFGAGAPPGQAGLVGDARTTVLQLQSLLTDARATLTKVDGVLAEAQGIAANTRSATADLGTLRSEVEASLRRVQQLADELNRRWPFARDNEVKLP